MRYQYKREPLTGDEATRLANACNPHEEKLVVWTLLDTGLRVSELANLKRANLDWQTHRLMIYGKGGPFGSKSKRRVIPLSARIQPLIEGYFALHETFRFSTRTIQRMLKRIANRARISRTVSPHVLRHTFAVTAIQKGISLPALQRLLGHDTLLTTEIYLNLSPEHGGRRVSAEVVTSQATTSPSNRPSGRFFIALTRRDRARSSASASSRGNIFLTIYRLPEATQPLAGRREASPKSSVWVGLRPIESDIGCYHYLSAKG